MNAVSRTRGLVAALGALALLTLGACSSADSDQASSSATTSTASQTVSDDPVVATDGSSDPATTDGGSLGATDGSSMATAAVSEIPTPATTEVLPSGGAGNITETVAQIFRSTQPSVPLTATAEAAAGVKISLTSVEEITTQAELPGEISGPGLKITVSIVNGSTAALDLGNVVVDLLDAAGTPAIPMVADPASPFNGSLESGATGTGVFVFSKPATYTGPATVSVSYAADVPVVVFIGDTP